MELEDISKKLQKIPGFSIEKVSASTSSNSIEKSKIQEKNVLFDKVDQFKIKEVKSGFSIEKVSGSTSSNSMEKSKIQDKHVLFLDEVDQLNIKEENPDDELLVEVPMNMFEEYNDDNDKNEDDSNNESSIESLDLNDDSSDIYFEELDQNGPSKTKRQCFNHEKNLIDTLIIFKCTKCLEIYNSFNELVDHMQSKVCFTEIFACEICSKEFKNNRCLSRHKSYTHKPKIKFICEECAKSFFNKLELEMHMQSAHNHESPHKNSLIVFKCTHCTEEFNNHKDLCIHMKDHDREKKEGAKLCETCGKNCINLKAYRRHIKTHAEPIKNNVCLVCNKRFTKGSELTAHSHVHTGIKLFRCDLCNKSFAKKDSLRLHNINIHKDKIVSFYNYTCEDCKIGFKSFENFKIHTTKCNSHFS